MKKINLLVLLVLVGCGPDVVSKTVIDVSEPYETELSCTHYDYCYTCIGYGGCKFKYSPFCPGTQDAVVRDVKVLIEYEDFTSEVKKHIKVVEDGACT